MIEVPIDQIFVLKINSTPISTKSCRNVAATFHRNFATFCKKNWNVAKSFPGSCEEVAMGRFIATGRCFNVFDRLRNLYETSRERTGNVVIDNEILFW